MNDMLHMRQWFVEPTKQFTCLDFMCGKPTFCHRCVYIIHNFPNTEMAQVIGIQTQEMHGCGEAMQSDYHAC